MRRLALLLVAAALAACDRHGSLVLVTVDASPAIAGVASLDVHSAIGMATNDTTLLLVPSRTTPFDFVIQLDPDRTGTLDVSVTLRDVAHAPLGAAAGHVTIMPGGNATLRLTIGAPDGGVDGASAPDLLAVDGGGAFDAAPDQTPRDLTMLDLETPDLSTPDLSTVDLAMPDLTMPDLSMPDLSMPDLAMPDLSMPDLSMPDLAMPDLAMPDLSMPDLAEVSTTLATGAPRAFLLDASTLYWLDGTGSSATLRAVPLSGGSPRNVITSGAMPTEPPYGFTATAQSLLYGDANGNVYSVPKAGGAATTIVGSSGIGMQMLTTDGTNVYWTVSASGFGAVDRAPIATGTVTPVDATSGQLCRIDVVVAGAKLYFTEDGCGSCVPGATPKGSIWTASTGGGSATVLVGGRPHPAYLATDGANVFWTEPCDGNVVELTQGGGVVVLATGQPQPTGIATDGNDVYFTAPGDGTLRRVPVGGGGKVVTLASNLSNPIPVAVDATSVYVGEWTSGGTIRKVTPK